MDNEQRLNNYKTTGLINWLCEEQRREARVMLVENQKMISSIKHNPYFKKYNGVMECIVDTFENKDKYIGKMAYIGITSAPFVIRMDNIDTYLESIIRNAVKGIEAGTARNNLFELNDFIKTTNEGFPFKIVKDDRVPLGAICIKN